ncbi:MAG TPA: helix-turn-helix transcriptional regulator [Metabacillus sp.]|nr:helix-turn-helix transcriptional regulator [Metabacillus sp.]
MIKSRIGKLMKESPYKREYIQKYMGVSSNTLSNWATTKTQPKVEDLYKLARLFGCKVDDLYEYKEERND